MTLRDKIAERLRDEKWNITGRSDGHDVIDAVASMFERGDFDDLLGVPEPTLADVEREARRVYGQDVVVRDWTGSSAGLAVQVGLVIIGEPIVAPTIAATYAALRALPTKGKT